MITLEQYNEMIDNRWVPLSRVRTRKGVIRLTNGTTCYFCHEFKEHGKCDLAYKLHGSNCPSPSKDCIELYVAFCDAYEMDDMEGVREHARKILSVIIELRGEQYPQTEA